MKYRSSIFSSESTASMEIPRHWWATMALLLVLLLSVEVAARLLLAPIGDHLWAYDSTALSRSFEWYRQQADSGNAPRVVAIGDSTGARNFDPASFSKSAAIDDVYSLARAANFPRALRSNTLPLLDADSVPEVVILLQSPDSLRDDPRTSQIEAGMVSSILEARTDGRFIITDYLHVTRLYRARSYLLDFWVRDQPLLRPATNNGFSPFDRQDDAAENWKSPAPPQEEPYRFSEMRRDVTMKLLSIARKRGFAVVAAVGPYFYGTGYAVANEHLSWLKALEEDNCQNLVVLDMRVMTSIPAGSFKDNHHLYEDGAEIFSRALGSQIRGLLDVGIGERDTCGRR